MNDRAESATTIPAAAAPPERPLPGGITGPIDPLGLRIHRQLGWNNLQIFLAASLFGIAVPLSWYAAVTPRIVRLLPLAVILAVISFIWMVYEYRRKESRPKRRYPTRTQTRARIRRLTLVFFAIALATFGAFGLWIVLRWRGAVLLAALGFVGVVFTHAWLRFERKRLRVPWARPTTISFTAFGIFHTLLTVALGLLALQTGLNLIVGIFGVLLTLIVVSGVLATHNFRGLEVKRELPPEIHAGQPVRLRVTVRNTKRFLPSYSLWLQEAWPDDMDLPDVLPSAYAVRVAPRGEVTLDYEVTFPARGVYEFRGFTCVTRFPFSLFTRFRYLADESEVVVLPRLQPLGQLVQARTDAWQARPSAALPARRGTGDFRALREYVMGSDDPKRIHWPTTARTGVPIIREFERETTGPLWIVLERGDAGEQLESAIELAAAVMEDAFRLASGFTLVIPPDGPVGPVAYSLAHRRACLEALARLRGYRAGDKESDDARAADHRKLTAPAAGQWALPTGAMVAVIAVASAPAFDEYVRARLPRGAAATILNGASRNGSDPATPADAEVAAAPRARA